MLNLKSAEDIENALEVLADDFHVYLYRETNYKKWIINSGLRNSVSSSVQYSGSPSSKGFSTIREAIQDAFDQINEEIEKEKIQLNVKGQKILEQQSKLRRVTDASSSSRL